MLGFRKLLEHMLVMQLVLRRRRCRRCRLEQCLSESVHNHFSVYICLETHALRTVKFLEGIPHVFTVGWSLLQTNSVVL